MMEKNAYEGITKDLTSIVALGKQRPMEIRRLGAPQIDAKQQTNLQYILGIHTRKNQILITE